MRKDAGVDGDAQRISQLVWLAFLKIFDDKEKEWELSGNYKSPIPEKLRWRNWAQDPEGITGDELQNFVNNMLFPTLKELSVDREKNPKGWIIKSVFEDSYNYMKSGTLLRQVINKLNEIDFNKSEDRHLFNDIYEKILSDLQSAGNAGEYYTPRPVTQFIVEMVNPKRGEKVFDPACGTGGFLICALELLRKDIVRVEDQEELEKNLAGVEKKPLPHMLCMTNMILHGVEKPNIRHDNSLTRPIIDYSDKDMVDIVVTNPPFGGEEEIGIEKNFPSEIRTRETADLFLALIMKLLREGGRCGIVLPDGFLFGEGVKMRLKEKLLGEFNLHTIIRLPKGVFAPYTDIETNLLFFEKNGNTKEIWYFEHPLPKNFKKYAKTKPIKYEEFNLEKEWWNDRENQKYLKHSWKVSIEEIQNRNYNLDIYNPYNPITEHKNIELISKEFMEIQKKIKINNEAICVELTRNNMPDSEAKNIQLFLEIGPSHPVQFIKNLKELILLTAMRGLLLPQKKNDTPASQLLEKIRSERNLNAKGGKNNQQTLPEINEKEVPYLLPPGWEWERIGNLFKMSTGGTPSRGNSIYWGGNVSWLKSGELNDNVTINKSEETITTAGLKNSSAKIFSKGNLVIALYGATAGKLGILDFDTATNQAVCCFEKNKYIETKYTFYFLKSIRPKIIKDCFGGAQPNISQTYLKKQLFPVPPLQEQQRIVEKIDSLMGLVDDLEVHLAESKKRSDLVMNVVLHNFFKLKEENHSTA